MVAVAQPPTGIVATRQGEVYFTDPGAGIWKVDPTGKLSLLDSKEYRSLALDTEGTFSHASQEAYALLTPPDAVPALLAGDKAPVTVAQDGHVYYANSTSSGHLEVVRLRPNGQVLVIADIAGNRKDKKQPLVNGIAAGPGNVIYLSEDHTVRQVTPRGEVSVIAGPLNNPECDSLPGLKKGQSPYLTGLAADSNGAVYAAATGCRSVFKIAPDGKISTIHKTPAPWTPAGVAIAGGNIYVLEYAYTSANKPRDWIPRVEKLTSVSVSVVATVKR